MKFGLRRFWKNLVGVGALIVLALIYFGFRYRGHVSSAFGWISEETGGKMMAVLTIALASIGLAYGAFCLIFPIIVFSRLNDLRRRIAEVAQNVDAMSRKSPPEETRQDQDLRPK